MVVAAVVGSLPTYHFLLILELKHVSTNTKSTCMTYGNALHSLWPVWAFLIVSFCLFVCFVYFLFVCLFLALDSLSLSVSSSGSSDYEVQSFLSPNSLLSHGIPLSSTPFLFFSYLLLPPSLPLTPLPLSPRESWLTWYISLSGGYALWRNYPQKPIL